MALLTILISLLLEKFLPPLDRLRSLEWFEDYSQWIHLRLMAHPAWQGIPALLLVVLLPVFAVGIAQTLLNDILGILGLLFSIAVLTYSLGARNPFYVAHQYLHAREHGDEETAQQKLQALLGEDAPAEEAEQTRAVAEILLVQTHERVLGIFFWLVVLGPMGAILYRLVAELASRERRNPNIDYPEFSAAAARLHDLMAWIPCRINAFCYAVMGSFTHALQAWNQDGMEMEDWERNGRPAATPDSHGLLLRTGLAAMQWHEEPPQELEAVREAHALCLRSLVICLTLLALLTLAGWTP